MSRALVCALITTLLPASVLAAEPCPALVPGKSLGPLRLGMTRAQVEKLGLGPLECAEPGRCRTGPFEVILGPLDDCPVCVTGVALALTEGRCTKVQGQRFDADAKMERIAAAVGECSRVWVEEGRRTIHCVHGLAQVWDSPLEVRVQPEAAKLVFTCDAYILPGEGVASAKGWTAVPTDLRPKTGGHYCLGDLDLRSAMTPAAAVEALGPERCKQGEGTAANLVSCAALGLELRFQKGSLVRIDVTPESSPARSAD